MAGISISLVIGNNGIITKAYEAKQKTENAQIDTAKALNDLYNELTTYTEVPTNSEEPTTPEVTDNTPPTIVITLNSTTYTNGQVVINVTSATDEGSGLEDNPVFSYYYKLSSESEDNYVNVYNGTDTSYTITGLDYTSSYTMKVTVADKAGNVGIATQTAGTQCFVAGTQILTENGLKNIEDIKIGDMVYTINIDNNERELKPVLDQFAGQSNELYTLTIGDEIIEVTPKHQFYVRDKGWIRAYELEEGDVLVSKDSDDLVINNIEHNWYIENPVNVYNLTVEGNHNYLVTKYEILVHNAPSPV